MRENAPSGAAVSRHWDSYASRFAVLLPSFYSLAERLAFPSASRSESTKTRNYIAKKMRENAPNCSALSWHWDSLPPNGAVVSWYWDSYASRFAVLLPSFYSLAERLAFPSASRSESMKTRNCIAKEMRENAPSGAALSRLWDSYASRFAVLLPSFYSLAERLAFPSASRSESMKTRKYIAKEMRENAPSGAAVSRYWDFFSPSGAIVSHHWDSFSPSGAALSRHRDSLSPSGEVVSHHWDFISPSGEVVSHHWDFISLSGAIVSHHWDFISPSGAIVSHHWDSISPNGAALSRYWDSYASRFAVLLPSFYSLAERLAFPSASRSESMKTRNCIAKEMRENAPNCSALSHHWDSYASRFAVLLPSFYSLAERLAFPSASRSESKKTRNCIAKQMRENAPSGAVVFRHWDSVAPQRRTRRIASSFPSNPRDS